MPVARSSSLHEWQCRMLKWAEVNANKSVEKFAKSDTKRRDYVDLDLQRPDWEIKQIMRKQDIDFAKVARAADKIGVGLPDKIHYTTRATDRSQIMQLTKLVADQDAEGRDMRAKIQEQNDSLMMMQDEIKMLSQQLESVKQREARALEREAQAMRVNQQVRDNLRRTEHNHGQFLDKVMSETCRRCLYLTDVERIWYDWQRAQRNRTPTQLSLDDIEVEH